MWARLCTGLLVLAMVASSATVSQAHLHTANGHRVVGDSDHAGDPARPLWHAHGAPHAHDADSHAHETGHQERPEDVVYVGGHVASPPTTAFWAPPVLVAVILAKSALDASIRMRPTTVGALPPVHAPPLIAPRSLRAPPTVACLYA